jgi:uncharacterized protein YeaO (DUF488 family)
MFLITLKIWFEMAVIKVKRVYEPFEKTDGFRILVDRLWPRGLKKEDGHVDEWLKEVAPSDKLRKWFNHDPDKWSEFRKKYLLEIRHAPPLEKLAAHINNRKTVTLLYGAKDELHNQAVVLKGHLEDLQEL